MRFLALAILIVSVGCTSKGYDSMYIPYSITGMNIYVYDNETNQEFYAGSVTGKYKQRNTMKSNCARLAFNLANENNLEDWSYICCTMTKHSNCVTKVR